MRRGGVPRVPGLVPAPTFVLVLAALLAPRTLAAQGAPVPPPPACAAAEYRQFDFWLGDWTVTDSAGTRALGSSRISREEGGCLLREQWTGAGGSTGQSLNAYDRFAREWRQHWVGNDGLVLHLRGGLRDGRMVLEGNLQARGGGTQRNRITWSLEPDGRVRQRWETSTDAGATWQSSFDGWYRRR